MIVWSHQTIVCSRQTIVWPEQTIVWCRQTMDDKGLVRQTISRTPVFITLKTTNNQILIRRPEAFERGAADRRKHEEAPTNNKGEANASLPPR